MKIRVTKILILFITLIVFAFTLQYSLIEIISFDKNIIQNIIQDPISDEEERTSDGDEFDDKLICHSKVVFTIHLSNSKQNYDILNDQTFHTSLIKIKVPPPKYAF